MRTSSRDVPSDDGNTQLDVGDYCRRIETYLCQKNDGHLVRIVGPSFDLVSCWAVEGIPLKIACEGVDRYCERYYRAGPRRRPVRIDFCDTDVRETFDDWRRATGLTGSGADDEALEGGRRQPSLSEHLTRVLARLTQARLGGAIGPAADPLIDALSAELTAAKAAPRGLRGEARQSMINRLAAADRDLLRIASDGLGPALAQIHRDAEAELEPFRAQMTADAFARARELAAARLIRERLGLPVLVLS